MADESLKTCFVICPIGAKDSEERRWSDDIFNRLIEPIASVFGYKAFRSIDDDRPGEITSGITANLFEVDLVVADLTWLNPNVMYELAVRHLTGKPFIHLASLDTALPFDVGKINAIQIDMTSLEGVDRTRESLKSHFQAVEEETASFDNPLSRYKNRKELTQRDDPMAKELLALRDVQDNLVHMISSTQWRLDATYPYGSMGSTDWPRSAPPGYRLEMGRFFLPPGTLQNEDGSYSSSSLPPRLVKDDTTKPDEPKK